MKYLFQDVEYANYPKTYNKLTHKELLQYTLSGMLYMPATRTHIVKDIITKKNENIKTICLDLEDSVGDDSLEAAEECLIQILQELKDALDNSVVSIDDLPLIFVRVRTPEHFEHILSVIPKDLYVVLTGFNFPKFEKSNCLAYLNLFENLVNSIETPLYFNPIIESPKIMNKQTRLNELTYLQRKLSLYSEYILNIRVGATDFCHNFGIRRKSTQTIYDLRVISDCLVDILNIFSKNYVVSGPVWEYFGKEPGLWSEGLIKELSFDKTNGFIGKTSIHPEQLPIISKNYIVDFEDYQDALSILGMSNGLIGVSKGFNNNKMNEIKTHSNWAKKIISLAEIYGTKKELK